MNMDKGAPSVTDLPVYFGTVPLSRTNALSKPELKLSSMAEIIRSEQNDTINTQTEFDTGYQGKMPVVSVGTLEIVD